MQQSHGKADDSMNSVMNLMNVQCSQYERAQANMVSRTGLAIVWCHSDVINNSKIFKIMRKCCHKTADRKSSKISESSGIFWCPAVARGPPISQTMKNFFIVMQIKVCICSFVFFFLLFTLKCEYKFGKCLKYNFLVKKSSLKLNLSKFAICKRLG